MAGRPTVAESQARTREFVRLVLTGCALDEASRRARVKPIRALAILEQLRGVRMVRVECGVARDDVLATLAFEDEVDALGREWAA